MCQTLAAGLALHEFAPIALLAPGGTVSSTLGVDFHDSTHAARLDIVTYGGRAVSVSLAAPMGEILVPVTMSTELFQKRRGQSGGSAVVVGHTGLVIDTCNDEPAPRSVGIQRESRRFCR